MGRSERCEGEAVVITGNHKDHGWTDLRREANVFTIRAEDLIYVCAWSEPMAMAD